MNETIEGKNAVIEALKAGRTINKIFLAEQLNLDGPLKMLLALAKEAGVPVQRVGKSKLKEVGQTEHHRGVLAVASAQEYVELDHILERKAVSDQPIILMTDGIEDPHNLGAMIRTAEAVGASGVVIPNRRNVGLTPAVNKASAGALAHMPVARVTNLVTTMETLKEKGYWIVGLDAQGEKTIYEVDLKIPLVMVVGSEGKGLSRLVKEKCDYLVKLPMLGKVGSLNASVAAAICLYEALKQRTTIG